MQSIKRNYTLNYKQEHGIGARLTLWQPGFWDHAIRDERDYLNHLDYIHYNPVKHGYATGPEDYPHSSYLEYVRRGWYEIGWGHAEPEGMSDLVVSEPFL
jgi:putative transposase